MLQYIFPYLSELLLAQVKLTKQHMSESVQYITNQQGERVGVLLDLDTYHRLVSLPSDDEMSGLSLDELQALADSMLAPTAQTQLNELLARNADNQLSADETEVLDRLLTQVDQLNILKTRARYTLNLQRRISGVA